MADARTLLQDTFAFLSVLFVDYSEIIVLFFGFIFFFLMVMFAIKKVTSPSKNIEGNYSLEAETKCFHGADSQQVEMMEEECILLDRMDNVIGHDTKKNCHLNSNIFGKGMLHRAFSVFIFNSKGELLMQKRSKDKITFPHYWANTCCSHPLYQPEDMETLEHQGVKNAARRKVYQELGIPPEQLPMESFRFITKVHYKAHSNDIWGEHEIDYILFCCPPKDVFPNANPNEVAEARYFSLQDLTTFVQNANKNGDLVSPWFLFIQSTLLTQWWKALLNNKLETVVEPNVIHRAPSVENSDGLSSPTSVSSSNGLQGQNLHLKQGAYGKVQIHKESAVSQLLHFSEIYSVLCLKYLMWKSKKYRKQELSKPSSDQSFCDEILAKTSRSFTAVIRQLPTELRNCVCIFYLVLRALDTVEDDMESFSSSKVKISHLLSFYEHLDNPRWNVHGIGFGDERVLLENFDKVIRVFLSLKPKYQKIIRDITLRMGKGMADFVEKDMSEGTSSIKEYNLYCYYVAGLVGEGLSSIFSESTLEDATLATSQPLSHSMGLFLQKTNIIRDYLEDHVDGRAFWPKEIWGKYGNKLGDFRNSENITSAVHCLNELVTNALEHTSDSMEYLSKLRDPQIFQFCAIPQVMAIATLDKCYNNPSVFTGVVKIRKGLAAQLVLSSANVVQVHQWFLYFARSIARKIPSTDPSAPRMKLAIQKLENIKIPGASPQPATTSRMVTFAVVICVIGVFGSLVSHLNVRSNKRGSFFSFFTDTVDVFYLEVLFIVLSCLFGFTGVRFIMSSASQKKKSTATATITTTSKKLA